MAAMTNSETTKPKKHRGPAYPSIDLGTAIERAKTLHAKDGFQAIPISVAIRDCGFSPTGSTGQRAVAALGYYGLLTGSGSKESKSVKLSELAKQILLNRRPVSPEREEAIRTAALSPNIFRKLWELGNAGVPSQANMEHHLEFNMEIDPNKVKEITKTFLDTISFAKLSENRILSDGDEEEFQDDNGELDEDTGSREEAKMPETGRDNTQVFDMPILLSAGKATLRVPMPMSSKDFETLREVLTSGFAFLKGAVVRDEKSQSGPEQDG